MVGTSPDPCIARLGSMSTAVLHSGPGVFYIVIQLGLQTSHKLSKQSQRGSCSPPQTGTCPVLSVQGCTAQHALSALVCREAGPGQLVLGQEEGLERWLILQLLQWWLLLMLPLLPVPGRNRGCASLHLPCWGMAHYLPCPQVLYFLIPWQVLPSFKAFIAFRLT